MFATASAEHKNLHATILCEDLRVFVDPTGHIHVLPYDVAQPGNEGAVHQFPRRGGVDTVAEVKIQEGESIESALRRFKRKVQQEDIIKDIKKHSFYLKPGDKRRAKQALARKRSRKKQRRESD